MGLAEQIAAAVQTVPGVAALHGGAFGEVATYLPGRQLAGIRIAGSRIDLHLTTVVGYPVHLVADAVRASIGRLSNDPVDVTIEDLELPSLP